MSLAGRHGKLSGDASPGDYGSWERVEDLLTADVFGALSYLPPQYVLVPALLRAVTVDGTTLGPWLATRNVDPSTLTLATIVLWPELAGREPDCFVELGPIGGPPSASVLIEAKLHSGQHEIDELSQVGWYAKEFTATSTLAARSLAAVRPVIYLTRGSTLPEGEVERAAGEQEPPSGVESAVFWLSWRTFLEEASRTWSLVSCRVAEEPWLRALQDMRLDLEARGIRERGTRVTFPLPPLPDLPPPPPWLRKVDDAGSFGQLLHLPSLPLPSLPHAARRPA